MINGSPLKKAMEITRVCFRGEFYGHRGMEDHNSKRNRYSSSYRRERSRRVMPRASLGR